MRKFTKKFAALGTGAVLILTVLSIGLTAGATSDPDLRPEVSWLTSYGDNYDASAVIQSSDGGFITCGQTDSTRSVSTACIQKFSASGAKLNLLTYLDGQALTRFYDIKQTSDGGLIAVGAYRVDDNPPTLPLIVKYNSSGAVQWNKTVSGIDHAFFQAVITTSDGGYVAAGSTCQDETNMNEALLIKYDASGNVVWSKSMGGEDLQKFSSVQQTPDGGYIAAGTFTDTATFVKFTSTGDYSSPVSYSGGERSTFNDIKQTSDGGYIAVGLKKAEGIDEGYPLIVKYNSSGIKQWEKTVTGTDYAFFNSILLTADDEYIAVGSTCQNDTNMNDALIVKYSGSGDTVWSKTLSGTGLENFADVKQTSDGGLVLVGTTSSNDGDFVGKDTYGEDSTAFIVKFSSIYDKDGDGIPNNRDAYPLDATKGSDTSKINLNSAPQMQISGTGSNGSYSGNISYDDYSALPANSNVQFNLNNVSVTFPVEVLDSNLDGSVTDSLKLSQNASSRSTINQASLLISTGDSIVGSFDFSFQKISADGTAESIHQLSGNVKVTISLTDDQVAQLSNGGTPKIYYFNTETNKLEDVNATFDLKAKKVTFYTNHFSTYVIKAGVPTSAKTGDSSYIMLYFLMAAASLTVLLYVRRLAKNQREIRLT